MEQQRLICDGDAKAVEEIVLVIVESHPIIHVKVVVAKALLLIVVTLVGMVTLTNPACLKALSPIDEGDEG